MGEPTVIWSNIDMRAARHGRVKLLDRVGYIFTDLPKDLFPRGRDRLYVEAGFEWDGLSHDALNQFGGIASSLAHDRWYEADAIPLGRTRKQGDYLLKLIQNTEGKGSTGEGGLLMYLGLRLFGGRAWKKETRS